MKSVVIFVLYKIGQDKFHWLVREIYVIPLYSYLCFNSSLFLGPINHDPIHKYHMRFVNSQNGLAFFVPAYRIENTTNNRYLQ